MIHHIRRAAEARKQNREISVGDINSEDQQACPA